MVVAKIDPKFPKFPPRPLPKPPELGPKHTDCFPKPPKPEFDVDMLKDNLEFSRKDADGNNNLNRDEFDAGRNKIENALDPKKFDRYDKDNDGYVDRKEYHAGKESERFRQGLTGKLELPKWEGKNIIKVGEAAKDAGDAVKDAVKNAVTDIF